MRRRPREPRPDLTVAPGERLLAWATTDAGAAVGGSRDALYLPGGVRLAWEEVASAEWDVEADLLRIVEVGTWGVVRPVHELGVAEPRRLLELVRERVTASVVLQQHVPLRGRRGVRVIGRRPPSGRGDITWSYEFDEGIDPDDEGVPEACARALAEARSQAGER